MIPKLSASAIALALTFSHPGRSATAEPDLATVRAATARFQDVKVAVAEGYVRDPMDMCDTATMMGKAARLGSMGIHYFRPDLLGIKGPPNPRVNGSGTHTDFRKPGLCWRGAVVPDRESSHPRLRRAGAAADRAGSR